MKYKEIWRDITGWEGLYKISSHGRVKSLTRWVYTPRGRMIVYGRILKERCAPCELYPKIQLSRDGKSKAHKIYVIVANEFLDRKNRDKLIVTDHIDHDIENSRISNLQLITYRGNSIKDQDTNEMTSRYTGVSWVKRDRAWRSYIFSYGKRKALGTFKSEIDAANAYQDAIWALPETGKITRYSEKHNKIVEITANRTNYEDILRTKELSKVAEIIKKSGSIGDMRPMVDG